MSVFCIRASSTPSTRGCSASASASTRECGESASASTRVLVHASLSLWGGGVESVLSGRGENTFGRLRESTGARLRGQGEARRERGGLEGAESLVAWRLSEGLEGAWSPGYVQCTRMREAVGVGEAAACECRAIEHSRVLNQRARDRALACDRRARAEALASVSPRTLL